MLATMLINSSLTVFTVLVNSLDRSTDHRVELFVEQCNQLRNFHYLECQENTLNGTQLIVNVSISLNFESDVLFEDFTYFRQAILKKKDASMQFWKRSGLSTCVRSRVARLMILLLITISISSWTRRPAIPATCYHCSHTVPSSTRS